MLNNKELIIFDCDGVLFDSDKANIEYFNSVMTLAGGLSYPDHIKGKIPYMSIGQLFKEITPDPDEAERLIDFSRTIDFDPYMGMLLPKFDFDSVLGSLRKNYYLSVASNRGSSLTKIFRHFDLYRYFHFKISVNESKAKPDPEMILKSIEYFDTTPEKTIFLGDSLSDFQSAKNANVDFLWVGTEKDDPKIDSVESLIK